MRVHSAVVLAAVCFASIDATKTIEDSAIKDVALIRSLAAVSSDVPVMRFLRKHKVATTDDEERGVSLNLGFLDDIARSIGKSWDDFAKSREVQSMLAKKVNANDAFTTFNVNKVADNLLETPEWKRWASYVALREPQNPDQAMATAMVFHLKADNLSKVLAKAAKDSNTKDIAAKIEDAQVKWWASMASPPVDILKALKLNKAADGMFDSPEFATFAKYLKAYNAKPRNEQTTLVEVFQKRYGEAAFLKMLVSDKNVDSPGATKLMDEVLEGWLEFTKSPYSAFKAMELDKAGAGLFTNPLFSTWVKYMKQFNEKLPSKQTTMIETLLKSYGDESLTKMINAAKKVPEIEKLATNLETAKTALFSKWMTEGITPDYLFKNVLKLDSATMSTNPNANIWRAYYNAYDKANPGKLFSFNP